MTHQNNTITKLEAGAYARSVERANELDRDHFKMTQGFEARIRLHMQAANGDYYQAVRNTIAEVPASAMRQALFDDIIAAGVKTKFSDSAGLRGIK